MTPGTVCNIERGQCLTPDQFESCVGTADGELCPIGRATGIRDGSSCTYFVGNSIPPSIARLRRSEPW